MCPNGSRPFRHLLRTEPTVAVTYDTHAPAGSTQEVLYLARVGQRALVQLSDGDRHPVGLPGETIPKS